MWVLAIPALFGVFYLAKLMFPVYKDDGVIEEQIEQVIKDNTGIEVDLTPSSPENKPL